MLPRQKVLAIIMGLAVFLLIVGLLRRRKLREEYSWLWLLTGAGILILAFCYPLLQWLTRLIGAVLPTSTLFFFGLIFLVLICLQFSVKLSGMSNQVKNLTQRLALLESALDEANPPPAASPPASAPTAASGPKEPPPDRKAGD